MLPEQSLLLNSRGEVVPGQGLLVSIAPVGIAFGMGIFSSWKPAATAPGENAPSTRQSYAYRRYAYEEPLPWDHLSPGVKKEALLREHRRAWEEAQRHGGE